MFPVLDNKNQVLEFIRSNSDVARLQSEVEKRLDGDPGHDMAHFVRVAVWTSRIGNGQLDPRHVLAAAFLHDIVNVPKNSPDRSKASELSAKVASELLPKFSFSLSEVPEICDAIRDHSFSRGATPTSLLGKALQDADRLESLGVLGVFRTISTGARMGTDYFHVGDPWAKERTLNDTRYSVDHFFNKLFKLPDLMNTTEGKREGERRKKVMESLLSELAVEIEEPIA